MTIVLFDNASRAKLFPLVLNKAIASLRFGAFTIEERWRHYTGSHVEIATAAYLQGLYKTTAANNTFIFIDATVLYNDDLWQRIQQLPLNCGLNDDAGLVAAKVTDRNFDYHAFQSLDKVEVMQVERLHSPQQIFQINDWQIRQDIAWLQKQKPSGVLPEGNTYISPENIFVEEGVQMQAVTINASTGPVYIGKSATIMEGACIRGPFVLGDNSVVKMGAKIYGATTVGANCVVGGELKNVVVMSNSNKAHDGYLGDSVVGEWCNFGAGTSNSNVKNTGGEVKLYNYFTKDYQDAGNKCGVIMGDYSRVAINSSINTGSVVGLCCNVFGLGLLPKFMDSYSWGTSEQYILSKALSDIANWKKMKGQDLQEQEIQILTHIFDEIVAHEKV